MTKEEDTKESPKKRGNPNFKKGMVSFNPTGRTKGSLNKYTKLSRELMTNKGPEIVEKVIELALEGDRHCLKMCLDRILPSSKAVEIKHNMGDGGINIDNLVRCGGDLPQRLTGAIGLRHAVIGLTLTCAHQRLRFIATALQPVDIGLNILGRLFGPCG